MAEIAKLVIQGDSSSIVAATEAMNRLAEAAERAAVAVSRLYSPGHFEAVVGKAIYDQRNRRSRA